MMEIFCQQARRFGAELYMDDVTRVDFSQRPFLLEVGSATLHGRGDYCHGCSARMLGLPAEKRLLGYGVSTCATCDGFFFRGKEVVVIGGGDAAMEEALFLTKFATQVTVIHRRNRLRASKIMQERAFKHEKIAFLWDTVVEDIVGEPGQGRRWGASRHDPSRQHERNTRYENRWRVSRYWPYPQFDALSWALDLDVQGYIVPKPGTTATSVDGVFAAGDIVDKVYRQAITAAGSGCMAAIDAERWLEAQGL